MMMMVETIGGSHKGAYARGRTGLTLEEVQADPLRLVNARDDEVRELFSALLEAEEDVEAAVELATATRAVFVAATADPYDFDAEAQAVEHLADLWHDHGSAMQFLPKIVELRTRTQHIEAAEVERAGSAAWRVVMVEREIAGGTWRASVWQALWRLLGEETNAVGACAECGAFYRGRADREFCGDACRKRAAYHGRR